MKLCAKTNLKKTVQIKCAITSIMNIKTRVKKLACDPTTHLVPNENDVFLKKLYLYQILCTLNGSAEITGII